MRTGKQICICQIVMFNPHTRQDGDKEERWLCEDCGSEFIRGKRGVTAQVAALRASFADAMHALLIVAALRTGSKRDLQDFARQERSKMIHEAHAGDWLDMKEDTRIDGHQGEGE